MDLTLQDNLTEGQQRLWDEFVRFPGKTPSALILSTGGIRALPPLFAESLRQRRVWMLTGPHHADTLAPLVRDRLQAEGSVVHPFIREAGEPTRASVDRAVEDARNVQPEVILGIGGGSTLDTAKAVAALAVNPGSVEAYLEGVGEGKVIETAPLPFLAVPTTAGPGSEMTKNAVVADYQRQYKKSFRDERMVSDAVLLDPERTVDVPMNSWAAGAMDVLAQLMEPCISNKRNPDVTRLAHAALGICAEAIEGILKEPDDLDARRSLLMASAAGGACLANAGLSLTHGVASGGGGLYPVPHGVWCGILLVPGLRYNQSECSEELRAALQALFPDISEVEEGLDRLDALRERVGLPPDLTYLKLSRAQVRQLAENSMGSSMSGNPIPMTADQVEAFLCSLI